MNKLNTKDKQLLDVQLLSGNNANEFYELLNISNKAILITEIYESTEDLDDGKNILSTKIIPISQNINNQFFYFLNSELDMDMQILPEIDQTQEVGI